MKYNIFLCNSYKDVKKEEEYIKALIEKSVDGVILTSNISAAHGEQYEVLKKNNIHCVLLDRYVNYENYEAGVFLDNINGAYMAAMHLLNHGHKDIVFITGPLEVATSINRLKGYEKAYMDKGMQTEPDLILNGDYSIESGYKHILKLLEEGKKFTAIFAGNDMMAIGAMKALKSKNIKIPEQVEIVGFDNIEFSQIVEPAITTVAQPTYEMGVQGAKMIIKLIEGQKLRSKNIYLKPELILRETTRR